VALRM